MRSTLLSEQVFKKLEQLRTIHIKSNRSDRSVGLDTLRMLFNASAADMMAALDELAADGRVTITIQTPGDRTSGKNRVVFVNLTDTGK